MTTPAPPPAAAEPDPHAPAAGGAVRRCPHSGARRAGWPMYVADHRAVQAWWHGLAAALREHGIDGVPDALDDPDGAAALNAHWLDPRLLLSQTCGYPLVTRLAGAVQVVGAFRWTAAGCDGIAYRSWLVARADRPGRPIDRPPSAAALAEGRPAAGAPARAPPPVIDHAPTAAAPASPVPLPAIDRAPAGVEAAELAAALAADLARAIEPFRGGVAAFNDAGSHSGCNALRALVAPLAVGGAGRRRFFSRAIETGSHRASLAALRDGRADVAAIDCVSWAGLRRSAPDLLGGLRVVGSSAPVPGLPLITSAATPPAELAALRRALLAACADAALADARRSLFIGGFEAAEAAQWGAVDAMRRSAALALGRDGW